ncbi:TetR/AcrR family transcriptional regulator [Nonomuraea pusilla]|uniref:Transcriptional regulator, TetR family n=1 Tax=Nonomuraea pusilla TaxID=46177 RepID=A0A1H7X7V8_9ACTN|nr:TetR/AcrR family transcriptional regulator [Nonomuraea pusilla]SEM29906.1 transcriptional regulator, TetR family [Nonomuraea pusilla]
MPKTVDHEERRRQIAEAAARVAASRGLRAASMREVAAEAGVSLRLVQYYFDSKEDLLRGVLKHLGGRIAARVARGVESLPRPAGPREVLYAALTALIPVDEDSHRVVLAYTAHHTLTLTEPHLAPEGLAYANALLDFLAERFREAREAGQLAVDEDPRTSASVALALVTGLQSAVLAGRHSGPTAVALLTAHLDRLFSPVPR